jgi:hypothetical protein
MGLKPGSSGSTGGSGVWSFDPETAPPEPSKPNGTGFPLGAWTRDRKRHRSSCPNGATHTNPMERDAPGGGHGHGIGNVIAQAAPTGQRIPAQGANPGNRIPERRCVLKEHRIGWAGVEVQATESMRRSFRTHICFDGGFPGLAPWAGMRCPVRAWDRRRSGGIGSNGAASTRQNAMLVWAWTRDRNAIVQIAPTR